MTTSLPKYILSAQKVELSPTRVSGSIKNILKKEPVFENEFFKIRNTGLQLKLISYNPSTKFANYELHGPEDMMQMIDRGEIVIDEKSLKQTLTEAVKIKLQYLARKSNPGKHLHFD